MIYLFNSAFKPTYFENVYRLMGLPTHVRLDIRYSPRNAPPESSDAGMRDMPCVVIYIDRFQEEGYRFYPMRMGWVREVERIESRVFYRVELGPHCHSNNPEDFTRQLRHHAPNAPTLTDGNPENENDGCYCVLGGDLGNLVESTANSWAEATKQIYKTKVFSAPVPAFFKIQIENRNGKTISGGKYGLKINANQDYILTLIYILSSESALNGNRRIRIRLGDSIDREIPIGSISDRIVTPINLPPMDYSAGHLTVETAIENSSRAADDRKFSGLVQIRTSAVRSTGLLFLMLAIMSLVGEFFEQDQIISWKVIIGALLEFLKFAIVVWAVFRFRGKLGTPF